MNVLDVLSPKICVPKKTKYKNVKVFNIITNKNEGKAMIKHISFDCIIKHLNVNVKIIISAKKIITGILAHILVRIANI